MASGAHATGGSIEAIRERTIGRALLAAGDGTDAVEHLERAVVVFASVGMPLETGRARHLLAVALMPTDRETAIAEARVAFTAFETLGAVRDADAAAAWLRSLGARAARTGPRAMAELTNRELEVLALLGEGLSNRAIGERLFITRKTVEHHVASVLSKVGLGSRGEAAAYAVRHLEKGPATK